jgi:hypothetical protein
MKYSFNLKSMFLFMPLLFGGCGIGFDHTLFITKSNVGLDVDTKPPTAEISIARRELVIAPAFEGGQTPNILAGFNTGTRSLFGFDVSSIFAGGDAALALTQTNGIHKHDAKLCLAVKPVGTTFFGGSYPLPAKGEIHPFIFGTDTSFGLKAAWSGMTAQFPDSLKIGFNRKEMALAPVFGQDTNDISCPYSVEMPAFLATIDVGTKTATLQASESSYRQFFATGNAATALAVQPEVQQLFLARLDRGLLKGSFVETDTGDCIDKWLSSGDQKQKVDNAKVINDWLTNIGHKGELPVFLYDEKYKQERIDFISEKSINCP